MNDEFSTSIRGQTKYVGILQNSIFSSGGCRKSDIFFVNDQINTKRRCTLKKGFFYLAIFIAVIGLAKTNGALFALALIGLLFFINYFLWR